MFQKIEKKQINIMEDNCDQKRSGTENGSYTKRDKSSDGYSRSSSCSQSKQEQVVIKVQDCTID